VLDGYITFLGSSSSGLVLPTSVGISAGVLYWLRVGKPEKAVLRAIGFALALLLAWACMGASVPTWWPDFCVDFGWISPISVFVVWDIVARKRKWSWKRRPGGGAVVLVAAAGYSAWYALNRFGAPVVFPFLKYGVGYFVFMLAPVALLVLWGFIAAALVRSPKTSLWLILSLAYLVIASVFGLLSPFVDEYWRLYITDALLAVAPCVLAVIVFGSKHNPKTRRVWVVLLYIYVGIVLYQALTGPNEATEHSLMPSLLSPQAVLVACFIQFGLLMAYLFRLIRSKGSDAVDLPLWSIMMPWLSLVPAFYFLKLGAWPFLLFLLPNLILGSALVVGFALRVGPFGQIPLPPQHEKLRNVTTRPRPGRILDLR